VLGQGFPLVRAYNCYWCCFYVHLFRSWSTNLLKIQDKTFIWLRNITVIGAVFMCIRSGPEARLCWMPRRRP